MDRRQLRTKQLLRSTLIQLMEEKKLEGITVTDITSRADINRGTFYLHYKDVPDMLEQIQNEVFEKISEKVKQMDPTEVRIFAAKGEPYPVAVLIFEEFKRHADFFRVIFGPNGDISYAMRFKQFMSNHMLGKLNFLHPVDDDLLIPRDYLISYMASANLGVVMHWLETGMKLSPREVGNIMTQIVNHGPLVSSRLKKS
jgi:AcrR family transcriptional regulator